MSAVFGEQSLSKVGARFGSGEETRRAAAQLESELGIQASRIRVVAPNDPAVGRKLEPESHGIAKTIVRSHVTLGIAGLLLGLLLAWIMDSTDIPIFTWNTLYTFGAFGFVGALLGMLLAGLISLRPDQDPLIAWTKEGTRSGRWFLLVHARDADEKEKAKRALEGLSNDVVDSL